MANPAVSLEGPFFEVAYTYDGTVEGLLTAIFKAYELREDPTDVCPEDLIMPRLGQYVRHIETDFTLAERVIKGICQTCGTDTFNYVKRAATCDDPDAGTDIYRFVRFAMKNGRQSMHELTHPAVAPMERRRAFVNNECEYMRQFVRFQELENGLFFARIKPKAKVIPLIMDWFAARFNTQSFIIYDEAHNMAGVYEGPGSVPSGAHLWGNPHWYLVPTDGEGSLNIPDLAANEITMQQAWRQFYQATTIMARYNPELRMHFMPKRFWDNLTEMQQTMPSLAKTG